MSIVYKCRHCSHVIGELDERAIDSSMLHFDQLSAADKEQMIHYGDNGDVHVYVICENCEERLRQYPHYHELDYFIQ